MLIINKPMGSVYSNYLIKENTNCFICWENLEPIDQVQCTRCNIYLHAQCEEIYRDGKEFCKCPHCQGIGTLCIG